MVSIVRAAFLVVAVVQSVDALDINWTDKCTAKAIIDRDSYWLNDFWFVLQVTKNGGHPETNQKCITHNFVLLQQDNGFSLAYIASNISNGAEIQQSYYARIATPSTIPAILHFEPYYTRDVSRNTIIGTDHRTYLIMVKCQPDFDQDLVQVLSKSTELSLKKQAEVKAKLIAANYNPNDLIDIEQIKC